MIDGLKGDTHMRDQNGKRVARRIRREPQLDGWGVNVWFGGVNGLCTSLRRHVYSTRREARGASIATQTGLIAVVPYRPENS